MHRLNAKIMLKIIFDSSTMSCSQLLINNSLYFRGFKTKTKKFNLSTNFEKHLETIDINRKLLHGS